tara:strand:+ start:168390 stop:171833 length:3444 start_codon:yes stop_codon:yes gene_type:complete
MEKWKFWIDCGGTFSDFVAVSDSEEAGSRERKVKVHKVLSHSPHYESAVEKGIEDILGHRNFKDAIEEIRLGTTVATNAFLERKGIPCALITTEGHRDILEIRQQNRPDLFELNIKKVKPLYEYAYEIEERLDAQGNVVKPLNEENLRAILGKLEQQGIKSLSFSLMHSVVNPIHELKAKEIAREFQFEYISLSHEVSPKDHFIARTETSVVDAYLSPFLEQYASELEKRLGLKKILYMQSNGQLCYAKDLKGHNALLSGPAGGLIGAVKAAQLRNWDKIITFDMGGTSTDVSLFHGELSLSDEPLFEGIKLLAPMVDIHTVAAGGGSILKIDDGRFVVGPESAGAFPGPACYRNGGPLTVTDANLFLGRIDEKKFPKVFGPNQNEGPDLEIVKSKFEKLAQTTGMSAREVAEGFLAVAVETMAQAVRKISVEKGFDPKEFTLVSFGGAGAQLAQKVADNLQMKKVFIHPLSSVLSAFGMGLAEYSESSSSSYPCDINLLKEGMNASLIKNPLSFERKSYSLGMKGSDYQVRIEAKDLDEAIDKFCDHYERVFGVQPEDARSDILPSTITLTYVLPSPIEREELFHHEEEKSVVGEEVLSENKTSIVVEKNWEGIKNSAGEWIFEKSSHEKMTNQGEVEKNQAIELEIFYQKFQSVAENMGHVLKRMAHSVNIKERNDFSCAIFKHDGELIANAPHIPVHLGSMGEAVKWVMKAAGLSNIRENQTYIVNHPLYGGTHLPDITLISPVFFEKELSFWVASRGHHADVGGISPGSMPGHSKNLEEEGVAIKPTLISDSQGRIDKAKLKDIFCGHRYPTRNFELNYHDIMAKQAANLKGQRDLQELFKIYGAHKLLDNANLLLDYSDKKIKKRLKEIKPLSIVKEITKDRKIALTISEKKDRLLFDFKGTSPSLDSNFNAPAPIVKASVLFCLRCLLNENIPLNDGLLRSIDLVLPENSMLNPINNAAVVAGNVETSQALCDLIFEVLDIKANSQGTMNNLTFGNKDFQYYETLAGGSGATATGNGASGVQVNMTNSLLTDPEVMEKRFPILINQMGLRRNSGGKGKFKGGDGIEREITFLTDCQVSLLSQFRDKKPKGLHGGCDAQSGENSVIIDDQVTSLEECFDIEVEKGQRILIKTPGGGGWGIAD